jgi:hypothetical protein
MDHITAAGLFLRINGWKLITTSEKLETCTLRGTTVGMKVAELALWLRDNTLSLNGK